MRPPVRKNLNKNYDDINDVINVNEPVLNQEAEGSISLDDIYGERTEYEPNTFIKPKEHVGESVIVRSYAKVTGNYGDSYIFNCDNQIAFYATWDFLAETIEANKEVVKEKGLKITFTTKVSKKSGRKYISFK